MSREEMLKDLYANGFYIITIEDERETVQRCVNPTEEQWILDEMESHGPNTIILDLPSAARWWIFSDVDAMCDFFIDGNQLSVSHGKCCKFIQ